MADFQNFEISISSNIGISYTVGKDFSRWTTFLLTKKSENVLNMSKMSKKVSKWRHLFFKFWHLFQTIECYIPLERIFQVKQLFWLRKILKMYSMWVKGDRKCQNDVLIPPIFDISSIYECYLLLERIFRAEQVVIIKKLFYRKVFTIFWIYEKASNLYAIRIRRQSYRHETASHSK